jgi:plasmid stability protein
MISDYSFQEATVAQFVVRNIAGSIKDQLQRRARRHGRSMEEEVREILRNAVAEDDQPSGGLGTEISGLFATAGLTADIPELRGYALRPATFEK